jgi:hypothetical protein
LNAPCWWYAAHDTASEPHKRAAIDTRGLPNKTVDLSGGDLSLQELLGLADSHALRVIARNGESYVISRLVG